MGRRAASLRRRATICFFYLSHGLVQVCEIELSHLGKNNAKPDLVCENISSIFLTYISLESFLMGIRKQCNLDQMPQNTD